jgi:type IV secretory pathway VirB10-like protein
MVAALSERAARERAARALMRRSRAACTPWGNLDPPDHDAGAAPLSPWLQPRLVEILEAPAVTATSLAETLEADAVLVPRDPANPVAEYQVLGPSAPAPAAPEPQAGHATRPARRVTGHRQGKPASSTGPGPATKAAKAPPKRAKAGQQSRRGAASKQAAKPAAKGAKDSGRRAQQTRSKRPATAVARTRRSPTPKRGAVTKRGR